MRGLFFVLTGFSLALFAVFESKKTRNKIDRKKEGGFGQSKAESEAKNSEGVKVIAGESALLPRVPVEGICPSNKERSFVFWRERMDRRVLLVLLLVLLFAVLLFFYLGGLFGVGSLGKKEVFLSEFETVEVLYVESIKPGFQSARVKFRGWSEEVVLPERNFSGILRILPGTGILMKVRRREFASPVSCMKADTDSSGTASVQ